MKKQSGENFEVIIIGGGAAGLSAALWCDELRLSALLLEEADELGGQLLWTHNKIKNYPGREAKNGRELCGVFLEQIEKRNFELYLQARIGEVDLSEKRIMLADRTSFKARAIIIAAGVRRRKLNVEGEEKFQNRGLLESGKKDAAGVAGKNVLIVGGGDAAFENALILAETAAKVTLAHRRRDFRARREFIEQTEDNPKIEILPETIVRKISGNEQLESVGIENLTTGKTAMLPVDALLIRIGVEPNSRLFREKLRLDKRGYIEIDRNCETNIRGVFAVGDIANPLAPTISSAIGMGAAAVKVILSGLNPES